MIEALDDSTVKAQADRQNPSLFPSQVVHRSEGEKSHQEMEGRGLSGFYRNTTKELFLKTMMENPLEMPTPTVEMLGF